MLMVGWSGTGAPVVAGPGGRLDGGAPGASSGGGGRAGVPPGLSVDTAVIPDTVSLFGGSINLFLYQSVAALAACLLIWASSWRLLTGYVNCTYGPVLVVITGPVYIGFMSSISRLLSKIV